MSEVSAGPRTPRAVSPAKGDGREVSAHSARSRRVPEGLRPLSRPAPAWAAGRGMPKALQNFGGRSTSPRGPILPVPRYDRDGEHAQHKSYPVRRTGGQPHQRDPPRAARTAARSRPASPAPPHRLTGPGRAGPGRRPRSGAPRTPALSARPRSARLGAEPAPPGLPLLSGSRLPSSFRPAPPALGAQPCPGGRQRAV